MTKHLITLVLALYSIGVRDVPRPILSSMAKKTIVTSIAPPATPSR